MTSLETDTRNNRDYAGGSVSPNRFPIDYRIDMLTFIDTIVMDHDAPTTVADPGWSFR